MQEHFLNMYNASCNEWRRQEKASDELKSSILENLCSFKQAKVMVLEFLD